MATSKRRSPKAPEAATLNAAQRAKVAGLPEWRWRTFPVFFAFFVGALVMAVLNGAPDTTAAAIAQFVVLAALSYGLARIFVRRVFMERRLTRREKRLARGENAEDDYEDVVVYPERTTKKP